MEVILTERFLTRIEKFADYIALDHFPSAINPYFSQMFWLKFHKPLLDIILYQNYSPYE